MIDGKDTAIISEVKYYFPVFKGTYTWLNKEVDKLVLGELFHDTTPQPRIKNSTSSYQKYFISYCNENTFPNDWYLENYCDAELLGDTIIQLFFGEESYSGGAHPAHYSACKFFNLRSRRNLALKDFLKKESDTTAFRIEALKELKRLKGINENQKLDIDGNMQISDEQFYVTQNFSFTDTSVVLYYNEYEIQSYAEGPVELSINKTKIKNILK
jgi:hypothetical protein